MPRSLQALLWDILEACQDIQQGTKEETLDSFLRNRLLRRMVERSFEIIGEALTLLSRSYPRTLSRISNARDIIAFRNVIAHAYFGVQDTLVWQAIQEELPSLLAEISALMKEHPGVPPLR